MSTPVLTFFNHKSGVGKTSLVAEAQRAADDSPNPA